MPAFISRPLAASFERPPGKALLAFIAPIEEKIQRAPGFEDKNWEPIGRLQLLEFLDLLKTFITNAGITFVGGIERGLRPSTAAWIVLPDHTQFKIEFSPNDIQDPLLSLESGYPWQVSVPKLEGHYTYKARTFREALSQLHWLIAPEELETWKARYTQAGTPAINIDSYKLLDLTSPLWLEDTAFIQWSAGATLS